MSSFVLVCRYPGGLKERSAELQFEKDSTEILRKAVYGMLPKNKLRDVRTLHLHCVWVTRLATGLAFA